MYTRVARTDIKTRNARWYARNRKGDPVWREKNKDAAKRWRAKNQEHVLAYKRAYKAKKVVIGV